MKAPTFATALVSLITSASAFAQDRVQQEAFLIFGATEISRVWILNATKTAFAYVETEVSVDVKQMRIREPETIWLIEPADYTEAMELYQGRNYAEAAERFGAVREKYNRLHTLPDNHSSLAAFYQMECFRKLGQLDDLKKAQEKFLPDDRESLSRDHQRRQLELYAMWEAVRAKDWPRLETICRERLEEKMPGYQRAQLGYCLGLALEGQNKTIPAINAYAIGMTADTGASEEITREGALNALRLYKGDEAVKLAIDLHGTADENPRSTGALRLAEAASLASLYELTLGGGTPLPAELKTLVKYLPQADTSGE